MPDILDYVALIGFGGLIAVVIGLVVGYAWCWGARDVRR